MASGIETHVAVGHTYIIGEPRVGQIVDGLIEVLELGDRPELVKGIHRGDPVAQYWQREVVAATKKIEDRSSADVIARELGIGRKRTKRYLRDFKADFDPKFRKEVDSLVQSWKSTH